MTFNAFEVSIESSRPIETYQFQLGGEVFRYCTSERSVTISASTYLPEVISRGNIVQKVKDQDTVLEIRVPATNEVAKRYLARIPGTRGQVTLQRVQLSDFPGPEVITLFQGFIQAVGFEENGKVAKISVTPITVALSRIIPRFTYQGSCNNFLYDSGCQVDPTDPDFKLTAAIVTAVDGNVLTVSGASGYTDGWFQAGFVEALGGADARVILNHVGDDITLLLPFSFDIIGQPVNVRAGCGHTIPDCKTKFNNVINYGGFAFVPNRDLFKTGII